MLNIYQAYPQYIEAAGPVEFEPVSIKVENLTGAYLDYALALSILDEGVVILDFLPMGFPHQVRTGPEIDTLNLWSPSRDEKLSQEIIRSYPLQAQQSSTLEALREIVRLKIGGSVEVPKIKNP